MTLPRPTTGPVKPRALADKDGDWKRLLEPAFGSALRRFFLRRTSSPEEAQDLTQEVFVRLLSGPGAERAKNFDGYVFTAAANLLREKGRRAAVRGSPINGAVACDISERITPQRVDLTPERILAGKEEIYLFIAGLQSLGERTRSVFVLHRIEGMSQKQIAGRMNISVSAVEKHVAKALVHLTRPGER